MPSPAPQSPPCNSQPHHHDQAMRYYQAILPLLRVAWRLLAAGIAITTCALSTLTWLLILKLVGGCIRITPWPQLKQAWQHFADVSQSHLVHLYSQVFCAIMGITARLYQYDPTYQATTSAPEHPHPWKQAATTGLRPSSKRALRQRLRQLRRSHQAGTPRPKLMVQANHISIIDIFLIGACVRTSFIAKSDVGRWPIIGWMSYWVGILFVNRDSMLARYRTIFALKKNSALFPSAFFLKLPPPLIRLRA